MKRPFVGKNRKPKICFVSHFAYGAMTGGESGHIGGVERQTSLMAKWFANHEYPVSMLTWDEGQDDDLKIDGVRIIKMCRKNAGIRYLRFFWPKWTSLISALKLADADIYYMNCAEYVTGQVALWCYRHDRRFIYSVASDPDCDSHLPEMPKYRERVLYRYGIKHADKVIVQTVKQKEMLWANFEIDSVVIPMPCPGPTKDEFDKIKPKHSNSRRILWIGRICEAKRPDRLLDLAKSNPDLFFDLVGPTDDSEYSSRIFQQAKGIKNITVHGPINRQSVSEFYRKSQILCCTSDYEGFPNTFLEAWSYGLPIVSTFDPDNLIAEKKLGKTVKDISGLAVGIRELLNSEEQWQKASQNSRQYYLDYHTVNDVMLKFEQTFIDFEPMPKRLMEYSISIRTLGKINDDYKRLIYSIRKLTLKPKEVIVVLPEGTSPPESILGCERFVFTNKGMFSQRIKSIEAANTDYILLLDDDVEFEEDFTEKLMNVAKDTNADILFPQYKQLLPKGLKQFTEAILARSIPIRHKDYYVKIIGSGGYSYNQNKIDCNKILKSESAPGMCLFVRKRSIEKIDYKKELWVDVNPYSYLEDAILVYKAYLNHLSIYAVPNLNINHLGEHKSLSKERRKIAAYSEAHNTVLFFLRLIRKNKKNIIISYLIFSYWFVSNFFFSILRSIIHRMPIFYYFLAGANNGCTLYTKISNNKKTF